MDWRAGLTKKEKVGAGEIDQWLRVFDAPAVDPGFVPRTHVVACNSRSSLHSWPLRAPDTHAVHIHTYRHAKMFIHTK